MHGCECGLCIGLDKALSVDAVACAAIVFSGVGKVLCEELCAVSFISFDGASYLFFSGKGSGREAGACRLFSVYYGAFDWHGNDGAVEGEGKSGSWYADHFFDLLFSRLLYGESGVNVVELSRAVWFSYLIFYS